MVSNRSDIFTSSLLERFDCQPWRRDTRPATSRSATGTPVGSPAGRPARSTTGACWSPPPANCRLRPPSEGSSKSSASVAARSPRPGATARAAGAGLALGVDLSAPMLRHAARRARRDGVTNVRLEHGDAQVHRFSAGFATSPSAISASCFLAAWAAAFAKYSPVGFALRYAMAMKEHTMTIKRAVIMTIVGQVPSQWSSRYSWERKAPSAGTAAHGGVLYAGPGFPLSMVLTAS